MALQKDALIEQYGVTVPGAWWVPNEVYINVVAGTARIVPVAFKGESDWNLVKLIRARKAEQETLQMEWRERRTAWQAEHDETEPFSEPEPFVEIPLTPPSITGEAIEVPLPLYLEMEQKMKSQSVNFFAFLYTDVLKNARLSEFFVDAQNV